MNLVIDKANLGITEEIAKELEIVTKYVGNCAYWQDTQGNYIGCNQAFQDKILQRLEIDSIKDLTIQDLPWFGKSADKFQSALSSDSTFVCEEGITVNGTKTYFQSTKTHIIDNGKIVALLSVLTDITKLKEESIYFDNLVTSLPVFLYWKNQDGYFLGANDRLARNAQLGSRAMLIGKTDYDTTTYEHAAKIRRNDLKIMKTQNCDIFDESGLDSDGNLIQVLSFKSPIINEEGQSEGIMGVSIDITEQRRLEVALREARDKAECANRAKSEFLACMSHDLKTPLNAILGITELLIMSDEVCQEHKGLLREISTSGVYLRNIIDDILMLAKLEANKMNMTSHKFNFFRLAKQCINKLCYLSKINNIELMMDYGPDLPKFFLGDQNNIERIIMNLLSNALKFTNNGCVLLSCELAAETDEQCTIQIIVEDTGIGIPQDKLSDIFEKFTQVEASYQSEFDGTGLGLSIVRSLVEAMDGSIGVNSQEGKGTTFWCQLPLKKCEQTKMLHDLQREHETVRIIIVDDEDGYGKQLFAKFDPSNASLLAPEDIDPAQKLDAEIIFLSEKYLRRVNTDEFTIKILCSKQVSYSLLDLKALGADLYFDFNADNRELLSSVENAIEIFTEKVRTRHVARIKKEEVNILMVEDDRTNQKIQSLLLAKAGFDCSIAGNAAQALELCKDGDYNILLLDIGLPDMSGFELAKIIRDKIKGPIIALTAHSSKQDEQSMQSSVIDDVLHKPVSYMELQQSLLKWMT